MLVNFSAGLAGTVVFLFIFWKKLKEDYSSEIIFKTALSLFIGAAILWILATKFFVQWFLFAGISGAILGLWFSVVYFKVRFYETLDALVIGSLPWLSFFFLSDSVVNFSLSSFLGFLVILIFIFIFHYLGVHYKEFPWYKSGRIGFAGLTILALVFLVRSVIAIIGIPVLSFVDLRYEAVVSGSLVFICFLALYNLGRQV